MPGLDVNDFYESDSSDNDESHSRLLSSVSQLDSTQRVKPSQRKEIASEVSEYNLSKGKTNKCNLINVSELARVLENKSDHVVIRKKFDTVTKKSRTLPKPLEKPAEERLKRSFGFEKVKQQLRRWNAIVTRNALNDHLVFPLNANSVKFQETDEFLTQFKTATPLEEEIAKVLKEDTKKVDEEQEEGDDKEFPLTLQEMLEKRKEMAQLRAKLSYKQIKAQRQSKIKSKKYHRLLKREKLRQQLKEFEILQKTDPEAALKKLAELDKTRAQERASLRHRNTGHWARNLTVRAKYDVETRKVLADQLKISRELTQKVSQLNSSDDEEANEGDEEQAKSLPPVQPPVASSSTDENPWTVEISREVQDFLSGYKKFWSEKSKDAADKKSSEVTVEVNGGGKRNSSSSEKTPKMNEEGEKKAAGTESPLNAKKAEGTESVPKAKRAAEAESPKAKRAAGTELVPKRKKVAGTELVPKTKETAGTESPNAKRAAGTEESPLKAKKAARTELVPRTKKAVGTESPPKAKKVKKSLKKKTFVSVEPASGVWLVTPVTEVAEPIKKTKVKPGDIDSLFDELNDELMKKARDKAEKINCELKKVSKKKGKRKREPEAEFDLSLENRNAVQRPDLDSGLLEGSDEESFVGAEGGTGRSEGPRKKEVVDGDGTNAAPSIDPQKFIHVKPKRLRTCLPDSDMGNDDALDDEEEQQKMMEEAFGDDDVMAEFDEMKKQEAESEKVEIETTLPGWGSWTGKGINQRRKRRLLVLNLPPRKDKAKKDVIINENENPNLKNHLVKEVPHPFKSVEAFEAHIRAPIGREWVPETAHHRLIDKPIVTKLGTVIEPMSENEIVRFKKASKSPYEGKKERKGRNSIK